MGVLKKNHYIKVKKMAALKHFAILDKTMGTDSLVWLDGRWSPASIHAAVLRQCERLARFNGTINTAYSYRGKAISLTSAELGQLESIAACR